MTPLPRIMVAPNGARLTKKDHPNLPLSQTEVVACAAACFEAGAGGIHAHIRDAEGAHLLDADGYRRLVLALRSAVPDMAIQITTEAAGRYDPDRQMQVALSAGADMVSASIREIRRAGRAVAQDFYATCAARGIAIQHILYDVSDCLLLHDTLGPDALRRAGLQLLFVLGRYSETGASSPQALDPFMDWMRDQEVQADWALCAFGPAETACLLEAAKRGGKCRVGFENSLYLSDGTIANSNAQKIADLRSVLNDSGLAG